MDVWKEEVLKLHNDFRAKHNAAPLTWSDECYESAKKQADACQSEGNFSRGNQEGPSGRHGQNAFKSTPAQPLAKAIEHWYGGAVKHDYEGDFQQDSGNFSQLVWVESQQVGMAKSENGEYMFANYFPGGNITGEFQRNVRQGAGATDESSAKAPAVEGAARKEAGPAEQKAAVEEATDAWKEEVLKAHNDFRAKHGASPLTWSDECYKLALKQAASCQENGQLGMGNRDGASGRHGQNVSSQSPPRPPADIIASWYGGVSKHDFSGDYQDASGNFSQVVWGGSQQVGMGKSANGLYLVANYLPGGNIRGTFQDNVKQAS